MNRRFFHPLLGACLFCLAAPLGCGDDTAPSDPPVVSLSEPADGSFLRGEIPVAATVEGEVLNVALLVDGAVLQARSEPPWHFAWATDAEAEGDHTVQVVAYGPGGVRGESAVHQVTVDRTQPTLTPPAPTLPYVVTGANHEIRFEAADNGAIARLDLLADDAPVGTCEQSPCTVSFDASARDDGAVLFQFEAADAAGNVATASLPALVLNQGTPQPFTEGTAEAIFTIPPNYASVEIDVKRHIDMPAGVTEILVAAQWERAEWPFELSIGTGECPHSGTAFFAAEATGGQVVFRLAASDLNLAAFPQGQWFLHLAPGASLDLGAHVDERTRLGFVAVLY